MADPVCDSRALLVDGLQLRARDGKRLIGVSTIPSPRMVITWWVKCDACDKSVGTAEAGWKSLREMIDDLEPDWWLPGWGWALCPFCYKRARRATDVTKDITKLDDYEAFVELCSELRQHNVAGSS